MRNNLKLPIELLLVASLLLVLYPTVTSAAYCTKVTCNNDLDSSCASWSSTDDEWEINSCDDDEVCNITKLTLTGTPTDTTGSCQTETTVASLFPGDLCNSDEECYSGICDNTECQGLGSGETCIVFDQTLTGNDATLVCSIGLYCDDNLECARGTAEEDESCSRHSECAANLFCNTEGAGGDQCQELGSQGEGSPVSEFFFCESGLVVIDGECAEGESYDKGGYREACDEDSDCSPASCDCIQANEDGKGSCGIFDTFGKAAKTNLQEYKRIAWSYCMEGVKEQSYDDRFVKSKCLVGLLRYEEEVKYSGLSFGSCYDDFDLGPDYTDASSILTQHSAIYSLLAAFVLIFVI